MANTIKLLSIIIIVSAFILYIIMLYHSNQSLKNEVISTKQNYQSLLDQKIKQLDSTQNTAISIISNLQGFNSDLKNKYVALQEKYKLHIAKIETLIVPTQSLCTDSISTVKFKGKKGIVSYEGRTDIIKDSCKGTYSLTLDFDTIQVISELYKDSLWQIKTTSLTPGISLIGFGTVDQSLFKQMQNIKDIRKIGLSCIISSDYKIMPGIIYRNDNWNYSVYYYDSRFGVGISYYIF